MGFLRRGRRGEGTTFLYRRFNQTTFEKLLII